MSDNPYAQHWREFGLRIPSPLSDEEEAIMSRVIGCAIAVHDTLGPGYLESIYRRAMRIELQACAIPFEAERPVRVSYREIQIPGQRVDLIVGGRILVELKSVSHIDRVHVAQVISYLKTTQLRGGLLLNFRVAYLKDGIRRIVL